MEPGRLSGIPFLRDRYILPDAPESANMDGYLYLNPYADNPLVSSAFHEYMMQHQLEAMDSFAGGVY